MNKPNMRSFERFAKITLQRYERYLPTAFDESLTLLEKMNKIIEYLNSMGLLVNDVVEQWNEVMEWVVNDGVNDSVVERLNEMVDDGTLETLINETLFNQKADKTYVDDELDNKVDKNTLIVNVKDHGVMGDGVTDDSEAIQSVLDDHTNVLVPEGNYILSQKIIIPRDTGVHFAKNSILRVNHDGIGVEIRQKAKISGDFTVHVKDNYIGSAVWLDGSHSTGSSASSFENTKVDNMTIRGNVTNGMGNGLHLDVSTVVSGTASLSFLMFDKVFIMGFEKDIFIDAPPISNTSNYVNGILFGDVTLKNADYLFYSTGDHSMGNQASGNTITNLQMQYTSRLKEMIHIEGQNNNITSVGWDISHKNSVMLFLGERSSRNIMNVQYTTDASTIVDRGTNNYISTRDDDFHTFTAKGTLNVRRLRDRNFHGDYQDILHGADKLHDLSILSGQDNIISGSLPQAFQVDHIMYPILDLSNDKSFKFELKFNGRVYNRVTSDTLPGRLRNIGFQFYNNEAPLKIIMEVFGANGGSVRTEHDMVNHRFDTGYIIRANDNNGLLMSGFEKITVEFVGQFEDRVRFARMFANSETVGGVKYLSNSGGAIVGDIDILSSGAVKLPYHDTQPSNHESHHRKIVIINTAQGDKIKVCLKQSDGSFLWVDLF